MSSCPRTASPSPPPRDDAHGRGGETAAQMDRCSRRSSKDQNAGFNALDQALAMRPGKYKVGDQNVDLELATANRLWGQKDLAFERAFLDTLAKEYGAGMQIVDYKTAHEAARRAINDWVAARTRDRIKDLIAEGVLGSDSRLVLTNAIYLKRRGCSFHDAVPGAFTAPMLTGPGELMSMSEMLGYGAGDGTRRYGSLAGGLSMVVIVPMRARAARSTQLDGALCVASRTVSPTRGCVTMPKFSFRQTRS